METGARLTRIPMRNRSRDTPSTEVCREQRIQRRLATGSALSTLRAVLLRLLLATLNNGRPQLAKQGVRKARSQLGEFVYLSVCSMYVCMNAQLAASLTNLLQCELIPKGLAAAIRIRVRTTPPGRMSSLIIELVLRKRAR